MVYLCCVPFCKSRSSDKSTSLHGFTKDSRLQKVWIHNIRTNTQKTKWYKRPFLVNKCVKICSKHFIETDFIIRSPTRKVLKKTAIPSVYTWSPKSTRQDHIKHNTNNEVIGQNSTETTRNCNTEVQLETVVNNVTTEADLTLYQEFTRQWLEKKRRVAEENEPQTETEFEKKFDCQADKMTFISVPESAAEKKPCAKTGAERCREYRQRLCTLKQTRVSMASTKQSQECRANKNFAAQSISSMTATHALATSVEYTPTTLQSSNEISSLTALLPNGKFSLHSTSPIIAGLTVGDTQPETAFQQYTREWLQARLAKKKTVIEGSQTEVASLPYKTHMEVDKEKSTANTAAERCREYRNGLRVVALRCVAHKEFEKTFNCPTDGMTFISNLGRIAEKNFVGKPKTSAERCRDYRERLRLHKQQMHKYRAKIINKNLTSETLPSTNEICSSALYQQFSKEWRLVCGTMRATEGNKESQTASLPYVAHKEFEKTFNCQTDGTTFISGPETHASKLVEVQETDPQQMQENLACQLLLTNVPAKQCKIHLVEEALCACSSNTEVTISTHQSKIRIKDELEVVNESNQTKCAVKIEMDDFEDLNSPEIKIEELIIKDEDNEIETDVTTSHSYVDSYIRHPFINNEIQTAFRCD